MRAGAADVVGRIAGRLVPVSTIPAILRRIARPNTASARRSTQCHVLEWATTIRSLIAGFPRTSYATPTAGGHNGPHRASARAAAADGIVLYSAPMERLPFQVTGAGAAYEGIARLPVAVILDNVRSLYNVGAFFRTADAARVEKLHLCGITGQPPKKAIAKTALGAEQTVAWEHTWEPVDLVRRLRERGCEIAAIETSLHAVDLFDWEPRFPVAVVFGHEVEGIRPEISALCDTHVRIPMLGLKHSLNVATAGGVVIYELLRKYKGLKLIP